MTRGGGLGVAEFVRAVAAQGLVGAPVLADLMPGDAEWADDAWWASVVPSICDERVGGPLLDAVDAGVVVMSTSAFDELVLRHRGDLLWSMHVERTLLDVADRFDEAGGLRYRVIKGAAVAHLDRDDPGWRTFADVDVLVHGSDLDHAVELLSAAGGTRTWAPRRAGFDRRFAKSVTVTMPDRVEVDIHRSLCDGVHGFRIPLDELFASSDRFELGGRQVPTLTIEHRLLHAAYHLVLGSSTPRLLSLRDLAGYLEDPRVDQEEVAATVARWRGEAVLSVAFDSAVSVFDLEVPWWRRWRERTSITDAEAAVVEDQRRGGSSFGRPTLASIKELSSVRERMAFGFACLWPTRAHLRSRGMSRLDLVRRLADRDR